VSHFAKVCDGKVTQVIVAEPDFFDTFVDSSPGEWIQTSYNTRGNVHYGPDGEPDGGVALRGNYAGIGYTYDRQNDVFYAPQPYASWTLDQTTWLWEPPVAYPDDGLIYTWDEATVGWKLVAEG
tara:strand:+ start:4205 stop:4576 length:372 start_codon:yes stop_codon:yes gene_type:complete